MKIVRLEQLLSSLVRSPPDMPPTTNEVIEVSDQLTIPPLQRPILQNVSRYNLPGLSQHLSTIRLFFSNVLLVGCVDLIEAPIKFIYWEESLFVTL